MAILYLFFMLSIWKNLQWKCIALRCGSAGQNRIAQLNLHSLSRLRVNSPSQQIYAILLQISAFKLKIFQLFQLIFKFQLSMKNDTHSSCSIRYKYYLCVSYVTKNLHVSIFVNSRENSESKSGLDSDFHFERSVFLYCIYSIYTRMLLQVHVLYLQITFSYIGVQRCEYCPNTVFFNIQYIISIQCK